MQENLKVVLVVPPGHAVGDCALGPSMIKATLQEKGIETEVVYLNLLLAERLHPGLMLLFNSASDPFSSSVGSELEEFMWSCCLWGNEEERIREYARKFPEQPTLKTITNLLHVRLTEEFSVGLLSAVISELNIFVPKAIERIEQAKPTVLGFSSVFNTICSTATIAREFRRKHEDIPIVVGGKNAWGVVGEEQLKTFPWIDFFFQGEAEEHFPRFVKDLVAGEDLSSHTNVISKAHLARQKYESFPIVSEDVFNQLPIPDYTDFINTMNSFKWKNRVTRRLKLETSRGCWWGQKHKCSFCSMAGDFLCFRQKSPKSTHEYFQASMERYADTINEGKCFDIDILDDLIPPDHYEKVYREATWPPNVNIVHGLTKVVLSEKDGESLFAGKFRHLIPGIESLENSVLKAMNKGTTAVQGVQYLKRATSAGLSSHWGYLRGMPGVKEDKERLIELAELLNHLPAPGAAPLFIGRGSSYFNDPDKFGIELYAFPGLRLAFPELSEQEVLNLSNTVGHRGDMLVDLNDSAGKALADWGKQPIGSHLLAIPKKEKLLVYDSRPCALRRKRFLDGLPRLLFDYCMDKARTLKSIEEHISTQTNFAGVDSEQSLKILEDLIESKIMIRDHSHSGVPVYLSLACKLTRQYKSYLWRKNTDVIPFEMKDLAEIPWAQQLLQMAKIGPLKLLLARCLTFVFSTRASLKKWVALSYNRMLLAMLR